MPGSSHSTHQLNKIVLTGIFKTEKRGWGTRALHKIPQGSFICVYVGNLFESEEANKQGQNFGDEYSAELDMIEMVPPILEGMREAAFDAGTSVLEEPEPWARIQTVVAEEEGRKAYSWDTEGLKGSQSWIIGIGRSPAVCLRD